jgi:broad-specificity NMP kinase
VLIYVTGVPGVGKSTIHEALLDRGYESYDVDDGFAATYSKTTGQQINEDEVARTREWHENNIWKILPDKVGGLAEQTENRTVFLCGVARNDKEVFDLFYRVIALDVDEETLSKRLSARPNRFGIASEEVELALEWQTVARRFYRDFHIPVVDATMPVNEVVEDVLGLAK